MKKKRIIVLVTLVFIILLTGIGISDWRISREASVTPKKEVSYKIGRNPQCFQYTMEGDMAYFKDEVKINGSYEYQGLYRKSLTDTSNNNGELLANDYNCCANYYQNKIYYIDQESKIKCVDLKSKEKISIQGVGEGETKNLLIIDESLYYIQSSGNEVYDLYQYDFTNKKISLLVKDVNWMYLYNYQNRVCTICLEHGKLNVWNPEEKKSVEYDKLKYEILRVLDDGTLICFDNDTVYSGNLTQESYEKLATIENTVSVIVEKDQLLITTIDQYGLTEVYIYVMETKELRKVANTDYIPRVFNEKYILCCSESGSGQVELVEIETAKRFTFSKH